MSGGSLCFISRGVVGTVATLFFVPVVFSYLRRKVHSRPLTDESEAMHEEK